VDLRDTGGARWAPRTRWPPRWSRLPLRHCRETVAANGCGTGASFPGDSILDLPSEGLYDQTSEATFDHHIDLAVKSSITGFLVDWQGTGQPGQSPSSSGYDSRLDLMVHATDTYNRSHGKHFSLGLAFAAFGNYNRPASAIVADLTYFDQRYGKDPAFANPFEQRAGRDDDGQQKVLRRHSRRGERGTRLARVPRRGRDGEQLEQGCALPGCHQLLLVERESVHEQERAVEHRRARRARCASRASAGSLPSSRGTTSNCSRASACRADGVQTLDTLWRINGASHPDGWFAISWNEFVENTYLEPSLRYGTMYLDELSRLIHSQVGKPAP